MRGLLAVLLIAILVFLSGCVQTLPMAADLTTPQTPSPAATIPATTLFSPEKTVIPTMVLTNPKSHYITINDVGTHYVGDSFYINGWSDLPNGSHLHIDIMQQLGRHPEHGDVIVGFSGDAYLNGTDGRRKSWELLVETPDFVPAMYDVTVTAVDALDVEKRAYFDMTTRPLPVDPGIIQGK